MSSNLRKAAFINGADTHHLDHLAVLSDLIEVPLLVIDREIESLCREYYPSLNIIYYSPAAFAEEIVFNFDILFTCLPRPLIDQIFFLPQALLKKKLHTIWVPHGNSDKGHASFFMEALKDEKAALIYGQKMADFLKEKNAYECLKTHVSIGNIRQMYYRRHELFYRGIIQKELKGKLNCQRKTILYAPTWQDSEKSSSFLDAAPFLFETLPDEYNLIVKLHPNLLLSSCERTAALITKYENHPQILFLKQFPPIFPLLDLMDIYIGDMSSIGYDCLAFNKPMFFLNQNRRDPQKDRGLYLFRCGVEIRPEGYAGIYEIMKENLEEDAARFSLIRNEVYRYTFGVEKPKEMLKQEISQLYSTLS